MSAFRTSAQVLEGLSQITKRLRAAPVVKVPIRDIFSMRGGANGLQFNFINVFAGIGFERLSPAEKDAIAPLLLDGIHTFPTSHQSLCLRLFLKVLHASGRLRDSLGCNCESHSILVVTVPTSFGPTTRGGGSTGKAGSAE